MTESIVSSFLVQLLGPDGITKQGFQHVCTLDSFQEAFDALEWADGFELTDVQLLGDLSGSEHFSVASLDAQVGAELSPL
jgi:hypothetical protein